MRPDSLAVNTARLLLFPIGVYIALRLSPVDPGKYLKLAVAIAVGISAYAVVQSSFFGFSFVNSYWGQPDLPIPYTFIAQYLQGPRASGTFASPNELGFALTAVALMAVSLLIVKPTRGRWAAAALFAILVALAVTFSRSAIVASAVGIAVILVAARRFSPSPRRTFTYLALAIVPALLLSGVIYEVRGGTTLIQSTIASLTSSSSVTDTGGPSLAPGATPSPTPSGLVIDPSTQGHLESLAAAWSAVQANPLGLGLGTVGSRADPLTSERPQYIFESWYLTMGVSLGWLGLAWAVFLPFAMFLSALIALRRGRSLAGLSLLGLSIALAIVSYLLPTMMEPQMAMLPWSLAALAVSSASGLTPVLAPAATAATAATSVFARR
jgi:O-antigen ligase